MRNFDACFYPFFKKFLSFNEFFFVLVGTHQWQPNHAANK